MSDLVQRLRDIAHGINAASNQAALREAADEIERLTTALRPANANHERYERGWYLRGDEIERLRAERNGLRALLRYARDDYDSDLMAVGHAPDSPARTRTMQRLRGRITAIDAALREEGR